MNRTIGLREKQTVARRGRILDAAAVLIRKTGGTDFTMLQVAEVAEVSPSTPYSMFATKAGVLYALLNRAIDEMFELGTLRFTKAPPLEQPLVAAEAAADLFAQDPVFFRPLFLVLFGTPDEVDRPRFMERSLDYWRGSAEAAMSEKLLPEEVDQEQLARALMVHFAGALEFWMHGDLDDDEFRAQVSYGAALHLLAFAEGPMRARLQRRMKEAKRRLPKKFSFFRSRAKAGRAG